MDNMDFDRLIPLNAATGLFPGRSPHYMTLRRWAHDGVLVHGKRIKLRTERCGSRTLTTRRWVLEFRAAQQHDDRNRTDILRALRVSAKSRVDARLN